METVLQDIRYSIRMFAKQPGFSAVAVLTLALGIGANSAIFSVVNALLLSPLPFKDPERIVIVSSTIQRESVELRSTSYQDFVDWRDQSQVFEQIAAFASPNFNLTGADEPEDLNGELVSASYFSLLGVQPLGGRTFTPDEDRTPDTHPVVVISDTLWQRRFGADPDIVGRTLKLNDRDYTVVGIMPASFKGLSGQADIWLPMMMTSSVRSAAILQTRVNRWHEVVASLRPGVTLAEAQAEMNGIAARLEQAYPESNAGRGVRLTPAHEAFFGDFRPALMVLFGAVGFVLIIACANVASLLLARAASRQKEVAIRAALGASRIRLVRQFLTESLILALAGGALGLLISVWAVDLIMAIIPVQVPSFASINIDARVLAFTAATALLTGIAFGLAPAFHISKPDLNETLKEGGRGSAAGSQGGRLRRLIVVCEIALALVLLIGSGLMIKSFKRLLEFNPGYRTDDVVMARVRLPSRRYKAADATVFSQNIIERLESLSGVQSVAAGSDLPLDGNSSATNITIEGRPPATPADEIRIYRHQISPNFFAALGISLIKGRNFTSTDKAQAEKVVIISELMARRHWPGEDPVGKRFNLSGTNDPWLTIVGVVKDVKYRNLIESPAADPDVYFPLLQSPVLAFGIAVHARDDSANVLAAIRREVQNLDKDLPLYNIATMKERIEAQTSSSRFSAVLLGLFACTALVLAAIGIYGVISYSVTQRYHEIGIRMALGAGRKDILKLVVGQGMTLTLAGVAIGLAAAFGLTRVMEDLLFGISATDPVTFTLISVVLAGVALGACFVPARRATKVDPMVALRYE